MDSASPNTPQKTCVLHVSSNHSPNTPWDCNICLHWGGFRGQCIGMYIYIYTIHGVSVFRTSSNLCFKAQNGWLLESNMGGLPMTVFGRVNWVLTGPSRSKPWLRLSSHSEVLIFHFVLQAFETRESSIPHLSPRRHETTSTRSKCPPGVSNPLRPRV